MTVPVDLNNRRVFGGDEAVDYFGSISGWTDRGEKRAIKVLADRIRGGRILDVGVGAGRTIPLLAPLAGSYVAVDFAPAMVQRCRQLHPDVDVRVGDARDLADFADGSFDFVMFSYNGLDAVDHVDRARVLSELTRVLAPGGTLLFSTLNKDHVGRGRPPWSTATSSGSLRRDLRRTARWLGRAPRRLPCYVRCCRNWWVNRRRTLDAPTWGLDTLVIVHEYGLLVHFVTVAGLREDLAAAGLTAEWVLTDAGIPVELSTDHSNALYFHVIARAA